VLLGQEAHAASHPPLARIAATACAGDEAGAVRLALSRAGLALQDLDFLDPDTPEAFPGLPASLLAPGDSASGADGARKVVTLAHRLRHLNLRYGLASLACDGGGLAILLERS
jgi:hypothetical protein